MRTGGPEAVQRAAIRLPIASRAVLSGLIFAAAFVLTTGPASADATLDEAKARSLAAFEAVDCGTVWNVLWPLAKTGNAEARALLFGAVWQGGLVPPGRSGDRMAALRDTAILAAYGSAAGDPASRDYFKAILSDLPEAFSGDTRAICAKTEAEPTACLDAGIASGLLPSFEDFAAEIDALAASGEAEARCLASRPPPVPDVVPSPPPQQQ